LETAIVLVVVVVLLPLLLLLPPVARGVASFPLQKEHQVHQLHAVAESISCLSCLFASGQLSAEHRLQCLALGPLEYFPLLQWMQNSWCVLWEAHKYLPPGQLTGVGGAVGADVGAMVGAGVFSSAQSAHSGVPCNSAGQSSPATEVAKTASSPSTAENRRIVRM
jgi:hypothetical protein